MKPVLSQPCVAWLCVVGGGFSKRDIGEGEVSDACMRRLPLEILLARASCPDASLETCDSFDWPGSAQTTHSQTTRCMLYTWMAFAA